VAINTNKRVAIKHVRDRAKSAYVKQDHCFICGSEDDLELHHTTSLTLLFDKWWLFSMNICYYNTFEEVVSS